MIRLYTTYIQRHYEKKKTLTMKNCIFFMFIQIIFTINSEFAKSANVKVSSASPIGPFQMVIKQVYSANPLKNNKLQYNLYLSNKNNKTMIFGNLTDLIPFDDTLFFEIKMALKDSSGKWKENSFIQKWPKACSTAKKLAGNAWNAIVNGLGFNNTNCPLLPGFYTVPGLDISVLKNTNLPKTFLYGTYKFHIYFTRQNEIVGGQVFIVEINRP